MLYKPKILYQRKRPAALIYAVVFGSSYSTFLVMLLFASFMMQPIHKAYANEAVLDPESVEETIVAEPVNMQEEELAEPELVDEPETVVGEETVDSNDAVSEADRSGSSDADETVAEETSDNTEGGLGDANDLSNDTATSSDETTDTDEIEDDTTDTSNDETATSTDATNESEEETSTASSTDSTATTTQETTDDTATSTDEGTTDADSGSSSEDPSTNDTDTTEEADETTGSGSTDNDEADQDTATTTDDTINEDIDVATTTATNTEPLIVPINKVEAQTLITDDNYYQFDRQACVAIGDGTYHCSLETDAVVDVNAVVYAELGVNMNMEIFLRSSDGEVRQLTDNEFDDTSPHYDAESMKVVWHRQIDDRYQVIIYDIEEDEEDQLTFSRTNNMEPKVSKDGVVWQAWDGNDWEIMYFDGKFTDQLTDNMTQDVAPAINEGYILWSVLGDEEQEARVYSLDSEEVLTINGYEGGVIANPRFVLVYDTMYDNGDVITQGFDPETGLSKPISSKPADDPIDLPDTDGTGETRALIQNKSTEEDNFNPDGTKNSTGSSTPNGTGTSTASTTDTLDLTQGADPATTSDDIIPEPETAVEPEATSTEPFLELDDFDLILTPPNSTTTDGAATSTDDQV